MRLLVSIAFAILASTSFLRSGFVVQIDVQHIAMIQLLQGLGLALFIMPINTILLSDLKPNEIAAGSGLSTFMRTVGASFAVSVTSFLWDRRAVLHHAHLTEAVSAYDPATRQAMAKVGHGSSLVADQLINQTMNLQAEQIAFNEVSFALGCVFLVAIGLVWLAKPPFVPKPKS
jgi:MFS transporter, DHA2 family, multidrug resistance protein